MNAFRPPTDPLSFALRSFGATLKVESNDESLLSAAKVEATNGLIGKLEFIDSGNVVPDRTYGLFVDGPTFRLYQDGTETSFGESRRNFINYFNGILRVAVGENSHSFVFLHAGVVGWRGRAIVIPGNSFTGKTTLVAELVKHGAEYYSDEYAILDDAGLVHPFARPLSMRANGDRANVYDVSLESLGGTAGTDPLPVGMLLLTEFESNAEFKPRTLSLGNGVIQTVPFAIPVVKNASRTIKRLTMAFEDANIVTTPRGEAAIAARALLAYFDAEVCN